MVKSVLKSSSFFNESFTIRSAKWNESYDENREKKSFNVHKNMITFTWNKIILRILSSTQVVWYPYILSRLVQDAYVRVRKKRHGIKGGGREEDGHVPPVARDQPNGFRLTPHTPRTETSPPLLSSPLPSRRAMPVQNTPDETLLFYWLWCLSPYGALPFDTLLSSSTLSSR